MAVHLFLKANGTDIEGESTQTSLGREGSIECLGYEERVSSSRDAAGSGMATGRRQYDPIVIRKRIDKSSPLLVKALVQNQVIEGIFKFFRPNPNGDGTTEQFYTVSIKQGRITSVRQTVDDTVADAAAVDLSTEEIAMVFQNISWTYTNGAVTFQDNFGASRSVPKARTKRR